jgi:hypothetical protein
MSKGAARAGKKPKHGFSDKEYLPYWTKLREGTWKRKSCTESNVSEEDTMFSCASGYYCIHKLLKKQFSS